MVAAAKLRRFQDMMTRSRPFTEGLETLLKRVSRPGFANLHLFIEKREERKTALVLITSDTGLCGSYNNDLVNLAFDFIKNPAGAAPGGRPEGQAHRPAPAIIGVGKFGITALKNAGFPCRASFTDLRASRVEEILVELRHELEKIYLSREVDAVYVIYSHFKTFTTYKAVTEKILPIHSAVPNGTAKNAVIARSDPKGLLRGATTQSTSSEIASATSGAPPRNDVSDYIFEPSPETVFKKLVPFFFEAKIRTVFLEAIVSEQIARMTAMSQATKNAREMIDALVLKRNKARQAAITKEIIEIVSGSQALKQR